MANDAASLVAQAKEWAGSYGPFPNGEEGAALSAVLRARASWEAGDADALADVFVDEGSLLLGDDQYTSREEIRAAMTEALSGAYKGTRLVESPIDMRFLDEGTAVVVTEGGLAGEGQESPSAEYRSRTVWISVRRDGEWRLFSYQSSPVA
ncbi:SgcJ/EcaC family oxidoreductase [Nocardiopsis exhalans]|uniref:SgcJ/EcaC family oxidoreductase n=1 Tax=Nocardiopsis exhalans TaxID=163604 RepID=A0ABY5D297_9ACTN|nr:SgcJ/EcaC family oxidoreductase [Nocardiopsis exhalans]USY17545.1 SgcJ/EcaC family oxidoreductase [Nocardiopsis exhalans]